MQIELEDAFVDFQFISAQAEITGECNMRCKHCRAYFDPRTDMELKTFKNLLDFCDFQKGFDFILSGGEPFLHTQIYEFLHILKERGVHEVVITTNGSLINETIIEKLQEINIPQLTSQVSLDHIVPEKHDEFRQFHGAYNKAIKNIQMLIAKGIFTSIRVTVTKQILNLLEDFVILAVSLGVKRIGFTSVVPSGNTLEHQDIFVNAIQKEKMFKMLKVLKKKYHQIEIVTGDPIKFLAGFDKIENIHEDNDALFFGGCEAGIARVNCDSEGTITPCALLPIPIINVNDDTIQLSQEKYVNNEVIVNLFERKLKGKCSRCKLIRHCGGCRAIAYGLTGDYLGEDISCFLKR